MIDDEIELRILRYVDDGFEDSDYMTAIVTALPLPQIFDLICGMLRSTDDESSNMTGLFLRDTILMGHQNPGCVPFLDAYPDSSIVKTLEELLFSNNYFTRIAVIYTLGKTCSYGSKDVLSQAFELFRETDPLLLDRLISEMGWLGVENLNSCIESMVTSSSYLTRWAAVGMICPIGDTDEGIVQWAKALRQDECELIRIEAEYEYQRVLKSLQTPILSKTEQRQRAKDIKKMKPLLSFQDVSIRFMNHLSNHGLNHYTVSELESFVELCWKEYRPSPQS